jgi:hypothetical protein
MTQRLREYYHGGKFTKKTILTPGGPASSYRVGEYYQFDGIGRVRLESIQTFASNSITDSSPAVPASDAKLLIGRLANGRLVTVVPKPTAPPNGSPPKKGTTPLLPKPLPNGNGVWLRKACDEEMKSTENGV